MGQLNGRIERLEALMNPRPYDAAVELAIHRLIREVEGAYLRNGYTLAQVHEQIKQATGLDRRGLSY